MKKYNLYEYNHSFTGNPRKIKVGDLVKLTFEPTDKAAMTENMWVIVTKSDPKFEGKLDNCPLTINIKPGDKVRFSAKHIRNWEPSKEL